MNTQEGEGVILSPCENLSNHIYNNNNNNNNNNNKNDIKKKDPKMKKMKDLEMKEENCECPNSANITWNLQVANGFRSIIVNIFSFTLTIITFRKKVQ